MPRLSIRVRKDTSGISLYTVKETGEKLELATTRPETMLGDTAVAINGEDPRYKHLHGCHVILPLMNIEIPIVCDEHADMEKGTGVVKITPAHDPNDFEVGQRHDLPVVRVFTYDGHMTGAKEKAENDALFASGKATVGEPRVLDCGKYAGMTTMEARKAIVKDLEEGGYLKSVEPLAHEVGTCYRCHTTIEPMVSKQWFVKMEPLAKPAVECVRNGEVRFVPERFAKNYIDVDGEYPATGASPVSSGGVIAFRRGTATTAARLSLPAKRRPSAPSAAARIWRRTRTFWIPGSLPRCGPSPRSAGRTRRRIWRISTRPACWLRAMTSSSSGLPA